MQLISALATALAILVNTAVAPTGVVLETPGPRSGPIVLVGTVVTMDDTSAVISDGHVLVREGRIAEVWSGSTPPRGVSVADATVIDPGPGTLIFPGLINLHDHPSFGILPLFRPPVAHAQPASGRLFGTEPYANRYQWNSAPLSTEYDRVVRGPEQIVTQHLDLYSEAVKHHEVQALLGGETAVQGAAPNPATDLVLARNVDNGAFGRDRVDTRVRSVMDPAFAAEAGNLRGRMQLGLVDAWIVHLAEGVRDANRRLGDSVSSRAELARISQLGLLNDTTVVVHGAGLERSDFRAMRSAPPARPGQADGRGAKLVWSPLSNLLLYGATARVTDALAEGVTVALGTDWGPSGSRNLLGELKVADVVLHYPAHPAGDPDALGLDDVALDRTLVAMVTRNAAKAVRWDREVGSVERGKVADLLVLRTPSASPTGRSTASPYRSLIDATERDVHLVLVGGDPLSGDVAVMEQLKPGDHERVQDRDGQITKAVDVTNPSAPEGTDTLDEIETELHEALTALGGDFPAPGPAQPSRSWSYLKARVDGGAWTSHSNAQFADGFLLPRFGRGGLVHLEAIDLSPLLTEDDGYFFDVLGALPPAQPAYGPYPANSNQVLAGGNPFATADFRERWWPGAG